MPIEVIPNNVPERIDPVHTRPQVVVNNNVSVFIRINPCKVQIQHIRVRNHTGRQQERLRLKPFRLLIRCSRRLNVSGVAPIDVAISFLEISGVITRSFPYCSCRNRRKRSSTSHEVR